MKKQYRMSLGLFTLTLLLAAPAPQSNAAILHDTLAETESSNWLVGSSEQTDPNDPSILTTNINQPADSFVVSGGSFFFESMTLRLSSTTLLDQSFGGGPGNDYSVRLWDDSGNNTPGTVLESITVPNSDSLSDDVVLSSILHPLLTNGSTYWISAALPDDQSRGRWRSVEVPSSGRATAFSNSDNPDRWSGAGSNPNALALQITGTPIPEPGSLALASLAILFGYVRRRR